jgi:hypothetical protein
MVDASIAIGSIANGLSLLDNLVKMIQNARRGGSPLSMADIVARLPVDAFSIAGQIINEIDALHQSFVERHIDLGKTIADLEADTSWWNRRQYRLIRSFHPTMLALSQRVSILIEDFVALTHCSEQEQFVSLSFAESRERREHIRQIVDLNRPVGQILSGLNEEALRLSAELGDLAHL